MSSVQVRHVSFAGAVIRRPRMYTLDGTFEEVVAFLEGYYSGLAKADPRTTQVSEWYAFQQWLSKKLNISPSELWPHFRQLNEDGQMPLERLAEWFGKFVEQSERQTSLG